ncbi:molybdopterin-dependent oxidoreductase [Pseudodesulfovibrio piezophilus]|uniref:Molybdopterin oxidoreductase n=1 Tax=Pseudodesulfovibrio piezophilus (strain DSM 21447 / JCM 15486 / C1TLV30) TaxID=1322246 RepID=M1WNA2_PSEP2|nr:molybdopterin-dependent oxidoreductase [Pseudodesulfovibrio piezophilus]CCH50250.1 Molybdopterin oxidoreductase [Pseudodesulfovibrio piezophilus C1TLV30]
MKKKNTKSDHINRRSFLTDIVGGGVAHAAGVPTSGHGQAGAMTDNDVTVVPSVCLACNARCGVLGAVREGSMVNISGNPYHPYNMQFNELPYETPAKESLDVECPLCSKGLDSINHTYSPYRLVKPLKRSGPRGSGQFEPIEWETLVAEIADGGRLFAHLGEDRDIEGLGALDSDDPINANDPSLGPKRNALTFITGRLQKGRGDFIDRFVKKSMGSLNRIGHTDICGLGFRMGNWAMTEKKGVELKADPRTADYILVFGANIYGALQPGVNTYGAIVAKRQADGELSFSVADPRATMASAHASVWLPVKPGHDGALAMGIARWIVDNERYNKDFLTAPNLKVARDRGFAAYSNACHLVITQAGHPREGKFLRLKDVDPSRGGKTGEELMVFPASGTGEAVRAERASSAALSGTGKVTDYFGVTTQVTTAFSLFMASLDEYSLGEYADFAGVPVEKIVSVAKDFTSHGTRVGVTQYHGAGNYVDGSYAAYAIAILPLLVGSVDMRGGYMKSGGGLGSPSKGLYNIAHFEGEHKPSGARISREKSHYEKTTEFREKKAETGSGYPSKRPWFPFSKGGLSCEALSGIDQQYPYQCKVLFTYLFNGVYSIPGGYRFKETLKDTEKLPLFVSIDTAVNETNIYADYIVPDLCYPEGHYGWQNPHAPSSRFTGLRIPIIEPLVGATDDGRPFCTETLLIDLAERLGLPGFGKHAIPGADGRKYPLKKGEDFYLRAYANIVHNAKVPMASAEDIERVNSGFPVARHKDVLTADQWNQLCYALVRGGVFQPYEQSFDKECFKHGYGRYALYNEDLAATVNTMTGKRFSGIPAFVRPSFSDGRLMDNIDTAYPYTVITYKMSEHTQSRSLWNSFGMQLAPTNYVEMNADDAKQAGLEEGETVRLISPSNTDGITGEIHVTKLIRPGCVGVSFHFGHTQFGGSALAITGAETAFLGGSQVASDTGLYANPAFLRGLNFNDVGRLDENLANTPMVDSLGGFPDFSSTKVRIVKENAKA